MYISQRAAGCFQGPHPAVPQAQSVTPSAILQPAVATPQASHVTSDDLTVLIARLQSAASRLLTFVRDVLGSLLRTSNPPGAPGVSPAPQPAPVQAPAPSRGVAPVRDYTLQPFAATSVWNLPISTNATFAPADDPRTVSLTRGRVWTNEAYYSHPITRAKASDPLAAVTDTRSAKRSATFQIPADAAIAAGTDKHMHIISPDGRYVHEAWSVTRHSATSYAVGRHHKVDLHGDGIGPQDGTRAYGGSAIGGLIRAWEVDPTHPNYTGEIKHPIALALRNDQLLYTGGSSGYNSDGTMKQSGYVWPATEQDWDSPINYKGVIPVGSYVAIPPDVDITKLGLSPQGLMLARAYQNYGGYVTDRASAMIVGFIEPSPAGNAFAKALTGPNSTASDLYKIQAQLRVVTNNTPATPNGGMLSDPRRAPLLPA